ncbi:MAG: glucosaminidase domain-containing protein, partial [Saprospiraceae bacterium]
RSGQYFSDRRPVTNGKNGVETVQLNIFLVMRFLLKSIFLFCILFFPYVAQSQLAVQAAKIIYDREASIVAAAQIVSDSFGAPVAIVERFMREAMAVEKFERVPAAAFVAIATLESTGFTSYLYKNSGNPFGMKAGPYWKGETFVMWHEGAMTPFRAYATPTEAVYDFARFLRSRKWFRDALTCPVGDYECFIRGVSANAKRREPGYAADPEWPSKVRRVIEKYNLEVLSKK